MIINFVIIVAHTKRTVAFIKPDPQKRDTYLNIPVIKNKFETTLVWVRWAIYDAISKIQRVLQSTFILSTEKRV